MKLIAHRGNYEGASSLFENAPDYIHRALTAGYDVEIDLWRNNDEMWLGHDMPLYRLDYVNLMDLVKRPGVWWHAKNYEALIYMLTRWPHTKTFAHETDTYGIVNGGYIWTASGTRPVPSSQTIVMIPNRYTMLWNTVEGREAQTVDVAQLVYDKGDIFGICCDDFRGLQHD